MSNPSIFGVLVSGREEALYLFDDHHDAEDFANAVRVAGEVAELSEELLFDHRETEALIDAEAAAGSVRLRLS
jgi:hypothetical protein